jgi:hypothetical protein
VEETAGEEELPPDWGMEALLVEFVETCIEAALEKERGIMEEYNRRSESEFEDPEPFPQGAESMTSRRVVAVAPREIERSRTPRHVEHYPWGICLGDISLRCARTMSSRK